MKSGARLWLSSDELFLPSRRGGRIPGSGVRISGPDLVGIWSGSQVLTCAHGTNQDLTPSLTPSSPRANDIPRRFYSHIGPGFSWARNGNEAAFPNCSLAEGRHWLSEATQDSLRKAQFNVTAVLPDPPEASALLEAFLVFWGHRNKCKPEVNVEL